MFCELENRHGIVVEKLYGGSCLRG